MTGPEVLAEVRATCEVIAGGHDLEVVEVVFTTEHRARILRVTLDRIEGPVSVDDLAEVSEEISRALDIEDPIKGKYTLEVSSAGIERPLMKPSDYRRFSEREVAVKVAEGIEGQRNFTGHISTAGDESFVLTLKDGTFVEIPYSSVARTTLVVDWAAELAGHGGAGQQGKGETL
ncbi:MAG: ribosome maturation factor RimP [Actinomycetota bacterium]